MKAYETLESDMRYWEPLDEGQLDRIHDAACRLLEEPGLRVLLPEAVEILVDAGARHVGDGVVRFSRELIEESIRRAPARFTVYDRQQNAFVIGDDSHHHMIGATMTEILEYPGWTRRPAKLADARNLAVLADALPYIDFTAPAVEGMDAPPGMGEILSIAEMLKGSSQFCLACPVEARANEAFVAMAKALAGTDDLSARPTIALLGSILPGFTLAPEAARAMMIAAREGIPIILMGAAINGMQGPATMVGALVMKLAEQLAALCLVQAVRPGSLCLFDFEQFKLDMRTSELDESGPESALGIAAGAQLGRRYGIPSYACPASDSRAVDFQSGYEMTQGLQAAMLSGIHVTVNAGAAARCSAVSYELLMLHHEMVRNLLRLRRGLTVSEDTLAVEVMREVGFGGDYLEHPHTLRYIRDEEEFIHKDLFDATGNRMPYVDPCKAAQERWHQILREHKPAVSKEESEAIDTVAAAFVGK